LARDPKFCFFLLDLGMTNFNSQFWRINRSFSRPPLPQTVVRIPTYCVRRFFPPSIPPQDLFRDCCFCSARWLPPLFPKGGLAYRDPRVRALFPIPLFLSLFEPWLVNERGVFFPICLHFAFFIRAHYPSIQHSPLELGSNTF